MKVIKVKNYEELSRTAATIIAGVILSKPDCILGLATGSSPVGTYDQLTAMYKEGILDFSHVKSVNLDEYVGLDGSIITVTALKSCHKLFSLYAPVHLQ